MRVIVQLTIVTQQGVSITNIGDKVRGKVVDRIVDQSLEFEQSFLSIYEAYDKEGNISKRFENCPCDITYSEKEISKQ